jgi:chromatin segregation and condensation protein Rec8/ScpA/Scc1 (kleisin family)
MYQRFKLAAARLRELEGSVCYGQLIPQPPPEPSDTVVSLPLAALERALRSSLRRLEGRLPEGPPVPGLRLRLADVVSLAERLLAREGRVRLDALAGPRAGRAETVLAFLAALDLVRRRRARAVQEGLFAPVVLLPFEEEQE